MKCRQFVFIKKTQTKKTCSLYQNLPFIVGKENVYCWKSALLLFSSAHRLWGSVAHILFHSNCNALLITCYWLKETVRSYMVLVLLFSDFICKTCGTTQHKGTNEQKAGSGLIVCLCVRTLHNNTVMLRTHRACVMHSVYTGHALAATQYYRMSAT